ncbi:hypothetical protein D3C81_2190940 [compost metagenome]
MARLAAARGQVSTTGDQYMLRQWLGIPVLINPTVPDEYISGGHIDGLSLAGHGREQDFDLIIHGSSRVTGILPQGLANTPKK